MAKTTRPAKAKKHKTTTAKPRKDARGKKMAPKSAKKAAKKARKSKGESAKAANRRKHRRYPTPNLWVTELSGDYRFLVRASNISEGGIFLKGRVKTAGAPSKLQITLGQGEMIEVTARPVHDVVQTDSCGAGYRFLDMSAAQTKQLRSLLRDLD